MSQNLLTLTFAPTGMLMKKKDTPHIPVQIREIINEVRMAVDIGITAVHLHARNEDETPAWEKEIFEEIILGIRAFAPTLIISVTTSGRVYNTFDKRSDVLALDGMAKPDMASLTLSSLNFNKTASVNEPEMIMNLAKTMQERGIKPELEVFDSGMVNYSKYLIKKELLTPPFFYSMIFGNIACAQATLLHAGVMVNDVPEDTEIIFGGVGNAQLPINATAIAMGYGVRVGLEDNIWLDDGRTTLATNFDYLTRIHRIAHELGREICSPAQMRTRLGLLPGNGNYGVAR